MNEALNQYHGSLNRNSKRRRLSLWLEKLESRYLLAGDTFDYDEISPPWFASYHDSPSAAIAENPRRGLSKFIGPVRPSVAELQTSQWIVRLSPEATDLLESVQDADRLLDTKLANFEVVRGLGLPGLLLVEGIAPSESHAADSLESNRFLASYSANESVHGTLLPDDSDFPSLFGLNNVGQFGGTSDSDIDAPEAWDITTGSPSVVVGVIDSGVDAAHPDLYLNIWINQGEIRDEIGTQLTDVDGDGLFTFYDLNDAANAAHVRDLNENGYIDAIDLLDDPLWADGLDTDGNGFVDDFFGWNFRSGSGERFEPNNPSDVLGHGTHVSGTIGAIGNNDRGVTGVNWQTSIMALKFLDETNSGDTADAIAAINYATMMRRDYGTNVRVTNNSWGQPGGSNPALETAIAASGEAGILFVAASGNGNILGQGIDNDATPFYPASFQLDNIIAVAASDSSDKLAPFSNFGNQSVDVAAPGVGILSTLPGGRYGTANGTSMATPHVAGAAALISASLPSSTPSEIKAAMITSADPIPDGIGKLVSAGRLNVIDSLEADVFAPSAVLISAADITSSGGTSNEITVEYSHRDGIDASSIGDDDIVVTRQWGPAGESSVSLKPGSVAISGDRVTATYVTDEPDTESFDNGVPVSIGEVASVGPFQFSNTTAVPIDGASVNTITSQIDVSNVPANLVDFSLSLDIDHTYVGDLTATLIAPDGSRAILFSSIGGSADNFTGTTFDDNAANLISTGSAPFTGTFKPTENISPLALPGANGTWTLEVRDSISQDGGSLLGWSLNFTGIPGDSIITSQIDIEEVLAPDDIVVSVDIAHTSIGDLTATLIAPDGTRAILFSSIGGDQDNFSGTQFSDSAATSIVGASHPFTGSYRPQESIAPLLASGVKGVWTLELEDRVENGEIGSLLSWSLDFQGSWDPLDFGRYVISTRDSSIVSTTGISNAPLVLGEFEVRVAEPDILYVTSFADGNDSGPGDGVAETAGGESTLRSAIEEANTRLTETTIILDAGNHTLSIPGGNEDLSQSGDLDVIGNLRIIGDSSTSTLIDGQRIDRIFDVQSTGKLKLERVGLHNGAVSGGGGGAIRSSGTLELNRSRVFDNTAGATQTSNVAGGGVLIDAGLATIVGSEISHNTTTQTIQGVGYGGGLAVTAGLATVEQSAIVYNHAQRGGGVFNYSDLALTNVTVSKNEISIVPQCLCVGSGILARGAGTLDLNHVTVVENRSPYSLAGGIALVKSETPFTATFAHSIIAGNGIDVVGVDLFQFGGTGDGLGWEDWFALHSIAVGPTQSISNLDLISTGDNLLSNLSFGESSFLTDTIDGEASLSVFPLGDNGGPSPTHALRQGSLAIDAASASSTVVDQRGVARPQDGNGDGLVRADIGAFESNSATIRGRIFNDVDYDGRIGDGESGVAGRIVYVDLNHDGVRDPGEPFMETSSDDPATTSTVETGEFEFDNLPPGSHLISQVTEPGWVATSVAADGASIALDNTFAGAVFRTVSITSLSSATNSRISENGRYSIFESFSSSLVTGDNNSAADVFVFDSKLGTVRRVNVDVNGNQANAYGYYSSISGDGRTIAYSSLANNLVAGDSNFEDDIYIHDLVSQEVERIGLANDMSNGPSLSHDGRFVAFQSASFFNEQTTDADIHLFDRVTDSLQTIATGITPFISADGNFVAYRFDDNIYVHSRLGGSSELISKSTIGDPGNQTSQSPVLSADGRFVAFASSSSDLITGDTNSDFDIFVYDRQSGLMERVSVTSGGDEANNDSFDPSISADGRFVAFSSRASNLAADDTNNSEDVFVFDRISRQVQRLGLRSDGVEPTGRSYLPSISADGTQILFLSSAAEFDGRDTNAADDVYLTRNPFLVKTPASLDVSVIASELVSDVNLGTTPLPGAIKGTLFLDEISNGIRDLGEQPLAGWEVFLDLNDNDLREIGEPSRTTDADGHYEFSDLLSERQYTVRAVVQSGFEQRLPASGLNFEWRVFLPAATTVSNRDFGFVLESTAGQFENGVLSGRLFSDDNADGVRQASEAGMAGLTVFIDFNDDGVRQFNEPRTVTDGSGIYEFSGLGNRNHVVRALLDEDAIQTAPLGSDFASQSFSTRTQIGQFTNVQDVVVADVNGDTFGDLVSVLFDANEVSILLGDGSGNFDPSAIHVSVSPDGVGPIALAAADLNGQGSVDLIVANNLNGTASVLLDFNGTGFDSIVAYDVGETPLDVVTGDFDKSNGLDFVVPNSETGTLTLMLNDGSGGFTSAAPIASGGLKPTSIVAGHFDNDTNLDLAVANFGNHPFGGDFGNVSVFFGQGNGTFTAAVNYDAGIGPVGISAADLDGDARDDLAVANFLSNTASILLGSASGSFSLLPETLSLGQGPIQVGATDIESDGDTDLLVTNLISQEISILRNTLSRGLFSFEPAESFGVAESEVSERLSFAVDDLDGSGTQDVVVANSFDDTVAVLLNTLVDGAHRVALTGVETITGLDFGTTPDLIPPTLDPITVPGPIVEDSSQQTIPLTGISKGRPTGPPLQFDVTSSDTSLIPIPTINHVDGDSMATLNFAPTADNNGQATITVTVTDAGADQTHGSGDDTSVTREFTIRVLPVNDPPTLTVPSNISVNEDSGAASIAGFATTMGPGGGSDESTQSLSPLVLTTDNSFFAVLPAIDGQGRLTFAPADNVSGSVAVNVSLADDGGVANGGQDRTSDDFVLNIAAVNDPPSIAIGGNQSAQENAGLQTVSGFATAFLPGGGADEASQVISDFIVINDNPGLFVVQPDIANNGTLTYRPAELAEGTATVSVQVRDSGGRQRGGIDVSSPPQVFSITITTGPDTTPPAPILSTVQPSLTNKPTFDVLADFGEVVNGFVSGDVTATGATVGDLVDQGNGRFVIPINASADGLITISIAANVAADLSGNPNTAATPLQITVDSTALVPSLTSNEPNPTSNGTFDVSIDFGETVTGLLASDLTVINGAASNLVDSGGGRYLATITAIADGLVSVVVPAGAARDAAGNNSLASEVLSLRVDTMQPTPVLSTGVDLLTNRTAFEIDVDFGEAVSGLGADDFTLSSGSIGNLADLGEGRFRASVTGVAEGAFTLAIAAGAADDSAGNPSLAAVDLTRTVDTTRPQPRVTSSVSDPTASRSFDVSIDFGEPTNGFESGDLILVGAEASGTRDDGNGMYTVTIDADGDGVVTIIVPSLAAQDAAGNGSLPSEAITVAVDTTAPVPILTSTTGAVTNRLAFDIIIDFGERVSGFELSDVAATGATVGTPTDLEDGRFVIPITAVADGTVTIGVGADAAVDSAGNASLAGTSIDVTIDSTALIPVLSTDELSPTSNSSFEASIDFGQRVTGLRATDLVLINATIASLADNGNGRYTVVISADADGRVTLIAPNRAAQDSAGNDSIASAPLSVDVDTTAPAPSITSLVDSPTNRSTFSVEVDFGEIVSGFDASDLALGSGVVESLTHVRSGRYLVRVSNVADGAFTLGLDSGAAMDAAGNQSLAADGLNVEVDTSAPRPLLTSAEPDPTTDTSFELFIDFGEGVTGFTIDDLTVDGGTARDLIDTGRGAYAVTIDTLPDRTVRVHLGAGSVLDLAGNANQSSETFEITVIDPTPRDFGDAPQADQSGFLSNYPTLLVDDGANHITGDLFLGAAVTSEQDGRPNPLADADDDDGIVFAITAVASPTASTISSVVAEASQDAKLDAWIDFNQDGDWNDEGEQILAAADVVAGSNLMPFEVPAGALPGETYARFRISGSGGLAAHGAASDGEVEDYLVTLADAATNPEITASLGSPDGLRVVLTDSVLQLTLGATILAQASRSDVGGIEILNQNETVARAAASLFPALISIDSSGRQALTLTGDSVVDLTALAESNLRGINEIELADGDQQLRLSVNNVIQLAGDSPLTIVFDDGDSIDVGGGWEFDGVELDATDQLLRRIVQNGTVIVFNGPDVYTNPIDPFDVNHSGDVTASDPLAIINELSRRLFSDDSGAILDPSTVDLNRYRFYDSNGDLRITSLDALRGINELARRANANAGSDEGEAPARQWVTAKRVDQWDERDASTRPLLTVEPKILTLRPKEIPSVMAAIEKDADYLGNKPEPRQSDALISEAVDAVMKASFPDG